MATDTDKTVRTTETAAGHAEISDPQERRDEGDRLASLYGLTPKVETAISAAVEAGAGQRARALVAPLHPADQADLLERLPRPRAAELVRMLGDGLDAETLAYLNENTRDEIVDVMGMAALARQLPELDTDDAVNIIEELEQDEIDDVLAALPAEDRVLVEEGLSYPRGFRRSDDAARAGHRAVFLDGWSDDRLLAKLRFWGCRILSDFRG